MVNEQWLRKIAKAANKKKSDEEQEKLEAEERKKQEEHEANAARQIKEWPPYIEQKIEEAAERGEFNFEFECGDCDERVIKHLFIYFASLNPSKERAKRTRIVNYDRGIDEEYYTTVILFRW